MSEANPSKSKEPIKVSNVPLVWTEVEYVNKSQVNDGNAGSTHAKAPKQYKSIVELPGKKTISVPHLYDSSLPARDFEIPLAYLQYDLRPGYLANDSSSPFLYYNAQDVNFYTQTLPQPRYTIWILIKNTSFLLNTKNNVGYVKRRLVEEAIGRNIQIRLMDPNLFDLAVTSIVPAASENETGGEWSVPPTDASSITALATHSTAAPVAQKPELLTDPQASLRPNKSITITYNGQKVAPPDGVIPRVGANVDYFGLAVLRYLESINVLVFNPVNSIEIARDKLFTHQLLAAQSIPIPKTILSRVPFEYDFVERLFSYPFVLKLASGSRGEAVWKIDSREECEQILQTIDKSRPLIVQEFLQATKGRDLRCLVVGDKCVAACMRISAPAGFKANFHAGGTVLPVNVGDALEKMVVRTAQIVGLHFSGVDVLLDGERGYKICEINSSPGFEGLEKASEADCAKSMLDYIETAIENRIQSGLASLVQKLKIRNYPLQEDHLEAIREVHATGNEEKAC